MTRSIPLSHLLFALLSLVPSPLLAQGAPVRSEAVPPSATELTKEVPNAQAQSDPTTSEPLSSAQKSSSEHNPREGSLPVPTRDSDLVDRQARRSMDPSRTFQRIAEDQEQQELAFDKGPAARSLDPGEERNHQLPLGLSVLGWQTEHALFGEQRGLGVTLSFPLGIFTQPRLGRLTRPTLAQLQEGEEKRLLLPPSAGIEPKTLHRLVHAAWKLAGLDNDQAVDSLASRARSSSWLPELRLRVMRRDGDALRFAPTAYDPLNEQVTGDVSTTYEARATWRLDRLVFADEEVSLEHFRLERAQERQRLLTRISELLETWVRSQARAQSSILDVNARAEAALSQQAASLALDALTDGAWSATQAPSEHPPLRE